MKHIFNSDLPIKNKNEDKFNRYTFSTGISDAIINSKTTESLVIGLYGIWGEGKTSILNMIQNDLEKNDDIFVVKFNPWRFKDEDSLILNFFNNISDVLNKNLKNSKEKFGKYMKNSGISFNLGVFKIDFTKIGESLSDTELEKLKNRVNDFLKKSNKKIVIVIDDIDRLDKQELFSLFKLIKLTGDFSNTCYILSFDVEMVASALGERFASSDKLSGHNFLEKIIQVPLRIPSLQSKDLLNFTFELLNKIIEENQINLSKDEEDYIGTLIFQNILLRIKTPRQALRYANSLSFHIPLLKGEINNSDLILFEGIKIFYPEYYQLIKNNPDFFIETYYHRSDLKNNYKVDEFIKEIEKVSVSYTNNEKKSIKELIIKLFPFTKEAFNNSKFRNSEIIWEKEKRIASPKYFNRYFVYSVLKDEISDVYFDNYIKSLNSESFNDLKSETLEMVNRIGPRDFLRKISFNEDVLIWEQKKCLIKLIVHLQDNFVETERGNFTSLFINSAKKATELIYNMFKTHNNEEEKFKIAQSLIKDLRFELLQELMWWFIFDKNNDPLSFNENYLQQLEKEYIERILKEVSLDNSNIFIKFKNSILSILDFWYNINKVQLYQYFDNIISENSKSTIRDIIYSLTNNIISISNTEPYRVDFKEKSYELLKKYYDVDKLYQALMENYKNEIEEETVKFFDMEKGQTENNAMRQFVYWYNEDKSNLFKKNNH